MVIAIYEAKMFLSIIVFLIFWSILYKWKV